MITTLFFAAKLCGAIVTTWNVPAKLACESSLAITVVSKHSGFDATLIAAIAYHETKFKRNLIGSRDECGPMQVKHYRNRDKLCAMAVTDPFEAYRQGVERLTMGLESCDYDYVCTLNVYASGPKGKKLKHPGEAAREFRELEWELWKTILGIEEKQS